MDGYAEYISQHRPHELACFWMALHSDCQGAIDASKEDGPISSVRQAKPSQLAEQQKSLLNPLLWLAGSDPRIGLCQPVPNSACDFVQHFWRDTLRQFIQEMTEDRAVQLWEKLLSLRRQ